MASKAGYFVSIKGFVEVDPDELGALGTRPWWRFPMTSQSLTSLAARAEAGSGAPTEHDLYYLRSIYRNLREVQKEISAGWPGVLPSIGSEILDDNINWLDCFIDEHTRALAAQQLDRPTEGE